MTTLTESFTGTGAALGADLTWTEITGTWSRTSDTARKTATNSVTEQARAESDVSSSDNYCQVKSLLASNRFGGPLCRMSASAITAYGSYNDDAQQVLSKFVDGAQTDLAAGTMAYAANQVSKVEANSSTIKGYTDGVEKISTTDTSISSGTRGGLFVFLASTSATYDDWELGDIGGGEEPASILLFVARDMANIADMKDMRG